jgi:hypothetical protein
MEKFKPKKHRWALESGRELMVDWFAFGAATIEGLLPSGPMRVDMNFPFLSGDRLALAVLVRELIRIAPEMADHAWASGEEDLGRALGLNFSMIPPISTRQIYDPRQRIPRGPLHT